MRARLSCLDTSELLSAPSPDIVAPTLQPGARVTARHITDPTTAMPGPVVRTSNRRGTRYRDRGRQHRCRGAAQAHRSREGHRARRRVAPIGGRCRRPRMSSHATWLHLTRRPHRVIIRSRRGSRFTTVIRLRSVIALYLGPGWTVRSTGVVPRPRIGRVSPPTDRDFLASVVHGSRGMECP